MSWCEECAGHYAGHYDERDNHRIGVEYGPAGRALALEAEAKKLAYSPEREWARRIAQIRWILEH